MQKVAPVTAVNLMVNSQTADQRFLNDVRYATLRAIHDRVPEARPMTVSVDVNVDMRTQVTTGFYGGGSSGHAVPILSSEPWNEPSQPMVGVSGSSAGFGAPLMDTFSGLQIVYTIRDASGHIVETHLLGLDSSPNLDGAYGFTMEGLPAHPTTRNPFGVRRALVSDTADFLASRVKALSH